LRRVSICAAIAARTTSATGCSSIVATATTSSRGYGKILLVTIPLLTLGGMILGYLIMTSRTTGESA